MVAVGKPITVSDAQMRVAEPRLEPAGERLIGQQRIEVHRRLGHADAMALGRDAWSADRSGSRRHRARRHSGTKPSMSCRTRSVRSTKPRSELAGIDAAVARRPS